MAHDPLPLSRILHFPECVPEGRELPQLLCSNDVHVFRVRILARSRVDVRRMGRCKRHSRLHRLLPQQKQHEYTAVARRTAYLYAGRPDPNLIRIRYVYKRGAGFQGLS